MDTGKRKLITGQDAAGWGLEGVVLGLRGVEDTHSQGAVCVYMSVHKVVTSLILYLSF